MCTFAAVGTPTKIHTFISLLADFGIYHAVICPGSRSAPVTLALARDKRFSLTRIVDERSAGYFALGQARQQNAPVAVICTSGTAVLNLYPAICEAYYQGIPIIAITADRPEEMIGIQENQAIRQIGVFDTYIPTYHFDGDIPLDDPTDLRSFAENIAGILQSNLEYPRKPVHFNFSLREPLYRDFLSDFTSSISQHIPFSVSKVRQALREKYQVITAEDATYLLHALANASRPMLLISGHPAENTRSLSFEHLPIPVCTDITDNAVSAGTIPHLNEMVLSTSCPQPPDLLLTYGGPILSKAFRKYVREAPGMIHIHISPDPPSAEKGFDTFGKLSRSSRSDLEGLVAMLNNAVFLPETTLYKHRWEQAAVHIHQAWQDIDLMPWCDLVAYHRIFKKLSLKSGYQLMLGNSSVIRYASIFIHLLEKQKPEVFANRGTSGIDGINSTAAGIASDYSDITLVLNGELAFLYDVNGLWQQNLPSGLRFIVFNNGGGNIFGMIDGVEKIPEIPFYFEMRDTSELFHISQHFGLSYFRAGNQQELEKGLDDLWQSEKPAMLEIVTEADINQSCYKKFYSSIKS